MSRYDSPGFIITTRTPVLRPLPRNVTRAATKPDHGTVHTLAAALLSRTAV